MKKITLLFSLLLVCLSSCTSCSTKDVPPSPTTPATSSPTATNVVDSSSSGDFAEPPTPAELEQSKLFSGDTWEIYIPANWKLLDHSDPNIVLSATIESNKTMLVLVKETYDASFDAYVLTAIRGLRAAGADLIVSDRQDINGVLWMYLEAEKNSILIYTWATIQGNFGYALSCGGPADNDFDTNRERDCNEIMQSLKLK